jgi:uncharacterized membrane protein YphA (DoxX/SURF4 family)
VRGSAVYLGRSATTPAALGAVHARLDAWAPRSRAAAAGSQVLAAVVLAGLAAGPAAALAAASVLAIGAAVAMRRPTRPTAAA